MKYLSICFYICTTVIGNNYAISQEEKVDYKEFLLSYFNQIPDQNDVIVFNSEIGTQFKELKRKIKLKNSDIKWTYELRYVGQIDISDQGVFGVPLIYDMRVIKDHELNNMFDLGLASIELCLDTTCFVSNHFERMGYLYVIQDKDSGDNDTLVVTNLNVNNIFNPKFVPIVYSLDDQAKRRENIKRIMGERNGGE